MNADGLDLRLDAPATHRNREPLFDVLSAHLPETGRLLEIAAGTGQHAVYFAEKFSQWRWQPTDPDARSRRSIDAWIAHSGLQNVAPALELDVHRTPWPVEADDQAPSFDAVLCVNMIHISPWSACEALMRGAGRLLKNDGLLITYGPYNVDGRFTAESNARFDASLRSRDPCWGIRDIQAVTDEAAKNGMARVALVPMPANNFTVVFRKA